MRKRVFAFLLALIAAFSLLAGCASAGSEPGGVERSAHPAPATAITQEDTDPISAPADGIEPETPLTAPTSGAAAETDPSAPVEHDPADGTDTVRPVPPSGGAAQTEPSEPETPEETAAPFTVDEDGEYTAPEDVADYLHAYGHLPGNFITKKEAQALGWPGGDLWKYAPGKSIGGDYFGNYEGLLPKEARYHECDVNYAGGSRGAERVIYGDDGSIYYTDDHYASFTQLY